ncbi:GIY-YIG nuclease family protein [Zunongwangia profunda]|nr:GIY-YIG nuclease family protein [Zunongwangia profunda]
MAQFKPKCLALTDRNQWHNLIRVIQPEIHLISAWNASMEIEKDLHKEFDLFRVRGEWFDLNIRDLERLNNYMLKFERIKVL